MKLWLIEQDVNTGYDTYDKAVVAAESSFNAQRTYPGGRKPKDNLFWADTSEVKVTLIGEAKEGTPAGVICASFNAG